MKILLVGAELSVWTDGWKDATKLVVAFRNFTKAPKNFISVAEIFENLFQFSASNGNKFRLLGK